MFSPYYITLYAPFFLFLCRVVHYINRQWKARRLCCGPPAAVPQPVWDILGIGQLRAALEANESKRFMPYQVSRYHEISARQGRDTPTFEYHILNSKFLFTCDAENIQAILASQFRDFDLGSNRRGNFSSLQGSGIFTTDGAAWQHHRALLRPSFARAQVADLDLEQRHCENLMQALKPDDSTGWTTETDLQVLFFRLTIDTATEFLFGESINTQLSADKGNSGGVQADKPAALDELIFSKAFDTAQAYIARRGRVLGNYWWVMHGRSFSEAVSRCHAFFDHYVELALRKNSSTDGHQDKKEKKDGQYIFLDELVQRTRDPVELRNSLLQVLIAGRDTTAGLLSWTFYLLARHPLVYAKIRRVILEEFGPYRAGHRESISFETLKSCTYLQHVLNETLRLYPGVPLNRRQATRDTTLPRGGGQDGKQPIFIPKNANIVYCVYAMHRMSSYWGEDAEEFKPERWEKGRPGWKYLPFNGGPRVCLGQQFALTEAAFVVVRILQRFDEILNLDQSSMETVEQNATLTLSVANGVRVKLHVSEKTE